MKLRFLGTRGEIDLRSPRHRRHSSLLVAYRRRALVIDWGVDWLRRVPGRGPQALLVTHAHPDHVGGLPGGWPSPVYATEETWAAIGHYPIRERRVIRPGRRLEIAGMEVEAFPLEHSLRAPAVGYRIAGGRATIFYAPDVVSVERPADALVGLDLYIGDGAAVHRSIVRRRDGVRIGHASIRLQLDWCASESVGRALFTHCGSQIVRGGRAAAAAVRALGVERGVRAAIAHDGMELRL